MSTKILALFTNILDGIWHVRNQDIFEGKHLQAMKLISSAHKSHSQYKASNSCKGKKEMTENGQQNKKNKEKPNDNEDINIDANIQRQRNNSSTNNTEITQYISKLDNRNKANNLKKGKRQ